MITGLMDKSSNDYRHACEVRWVISLGSMQAMKAYMDRVQLRRGLNVTHNTGINARAQRVALNDLLCTKQINRG